ncbi:MAG: hypothetical protein ACTSU9_11485 [Promethearchaeota archaeon]
MNQKGGTIHKKRGKPIAERITCSFIDASTWISTATTATFFTYTFVRLLLVQVEFISIYPSIVIVAMITAGTVVAGSLRHAEALYRCGQFVTMFFQILFYIWYIRDPFYIKYPVTTSLFAGVGGDDLYVIGRGISSS